MRGRAERSTYGSVEEDVVRHAPRLWDDKLLAMCLWDAWHSGPSDMILAYTEAAIPRAIAKGMTLSWWVESQVVSDGDSRFNQFDRDGGYRGHNGVRVPKDWNPGVEPDAPSRGQSE